MVDLNVIDSGSGDSAVVMLHSLGLDALSWRTVVHELSAQFRAIAIDLPGHGDTPPSRTAMTIEDYADVVEEFIAGLPQDDVTVVGNSFGSLVTIELARREPARVARAVLLGCPLWRDRSVRAGWLHDRSVALVDDRGVGLVPTLETVETIFGVPDPEYWAELARGFGKARHSLLDTIWAIYAFDGRTAIREAKIPVLAAYGSRDWLGETADGVPAEPQFTLVEIPDGSHLVPVDQPFAVAAAIAEFVSNGSSRAAEDA